MKHSGHMSGFSTSCSLWSHRHVRMPLWSSVSSRLRVGAGLTRVSIVETHPAVAGLHPRLANRLQAKLNPGAGLQVRQDECKVVLLLQGEHLLRHVVGSVEVEHGEEEGGELVGAVPGQRDAAAAPRRHLKVRGRVWVWWEGHEQETSVGNPGPGVRPKVTDPEPSGLTRIQDGIYD